MLYFVKTSIVLYEIIMAGFVYIMTNPSIPNMVKIGVSDKDPEDHRVNELSNTSVPDPFKVEYYIFTDDHFEVEREVHKALNGKRHSSSREFFTCTISEAIETIQDISGDKQKYEKNNFSETLKGKEIRRDKEREKTRQQGGQHIVYWDDPEPNTNGIRTVGEFKNKKMQGKWTHWNEDGSLDQELHWKDDIMHGPVRHYFRGLNQLRSEQNYASGKIHGESKEYYSSGEVAKTTNYVKGVEEGTRSEFYENGQLKTVGEVTKGNRSGVHKSYQENGKKALEVTYSADEPNGHYKEYYKDIGTLYREGKAVGELFFFDWKYYYPSGKISHVIRYSGNARKEGLTEYFYESGAKKMQQNFKEGVAHGIREHFDEEGNRELLMTYDFGEEHGPFEHYYENGNIMQRGEKKEGQFDGKFESFHKDGSLYRISYYEDGEIVDQEVINEEEPVKKKKWFFQR